MLQEIHINFTPHQDVASQTLAQIARLKQLHWDYPMEDQLRWIENNIQPQDIHLLVYSERRLLAYLNLVHRAVLDSAAKKPVLGVGNVCVDSAAQHTGLGALLMWSANCYLNTHHTAGILLCKASLRRFYEKTGWKAFEGKACDKHGKALADDIYLYVYNGSFDTVKLLGDTF
jgi:predicted GNAT family N-acyltransferase